MPANPIVLPTSYRDVDTVRWYILRLPLGLGGMYSGDPSSQLRREMERRERNAESVYEFFAPTYVEVVRRNGKLFKTDRPLLYNYVFVRGSERGIYDLKKTLPRYNFMSRVGEGADSHFPYLSDSEMQNLRWVARSYCGVLPIYSPASDSLCEGDRVRVTFRWRRGRRGTPSGSWEARCYGACDGVHVGASALR